MTLLKIARMGHPVLRRRAEAIADPTAPEVKRLAADMIETMRDAPGVGLAAPQVGVMERIFVYEVEEDVGVIVNPLVVAASPETAEADEGCLSVPGLLYPVTRAAEVTVQGRDLDGNPVEKKATELLARVFQHEIDHLDGVLFIDRLTEDLRKQALRELAEQSLGLAANELVGRHTRT